MSATSRLWTRRAIRAGWLLGPILGFFSRLLRSGEFWFFSTVIVLVLWGTFALVKVLGQAHQPVDNATLVLIGKDACLKDRIRVRAANIPITPSNFGQAKEDCARAAKFAEQMKVIEK